MMFGGKSCPECGSDNTQFVRGIEEMVVCGDCGYSGNAAGEEIDIVMEGEDIKMKRVKVKETKGKKK